MRRCRRRKGKLSMPEFIDWSAVRDPGRLRDGVREVLDAGGWVAFPTETGPALATRADRPDGLSRVPADGLNWSVALPDDASLLAWTGGLSRAARRLVRRTWPGPVAFEFAGADQSAPVAQ